MFDDQVMTMIATAKPSESLSDEIAATLREAEAVMTRLQTLLRQPALATTLNNDLHERRKQTVRTIFSVRENRNRLLGEGVFVDPAENIVLDCYLSGLEGRQVAVSDACIASGVPGTTALRWIKTLEEKGLLKRKEDARDRRRSFVALTERGHSAIETLVDESMRRMSVPPQ